MSPADGYRVDEPQVRPPWSSRLGALVGSRRTHYIALGVSGLILLVIGRDQWFLADDWSVLVFRLDGSAMAPHVGHWNLIPALVFQLFRTMFGLGSYLPFLALAIVAHLAVVTLVWRILLRVGVLPWLATLLGVLVTFLGAGAEDILWAFQFGFMGAVALGLLVMVLVDRERLTVLSVAVIVIAAAIAPMFSGTAIAVLVAAGIVAIVRHPSWLTVMLFLPSAGLYLAWHFTAGAAFSGPPGGYPTPADWKGFGAYVALMYAGGLGRLFPIIVIGVVPALAVAVWFVVTVRRSLPGRRLMAYALVVGSVVFALLTAYSRLPLGLTPAASQRYAYVTVVMLLPAMALFVTRLLAPTTLVRSSIAAGVVALLIGFNVAALIGQAGLEARRELSSERRVDADLTALIQDPGDTALLNAPADPRWAPDLLGSDLLELYRAGRYPAP